MSLEEPAQGKSERIPAGRRRDLHTDRQSRFAETGRDDGCRPTRQIEWNCKSESGPMRPGFALSMAQGRFGMGRADEDIEFVCDMQHFRAEGIPTPQQPEKFRKVQRLRQRRFDRPIEVRMRLFCARRMKAFADPGRAIGFE